MYLNHIKSGGKMAIHEMNYVYERLILYRESFRKINPSNHNASDHLEKLHVLCPESLHNLLLLDPSPSSSFRSKCSTEIRRYSRHKRGFTRFSVSGKLRLGFRAMLGGYCLDSDSNRRFTRQESPYQPELVNC